MKILLVDPALVAVNPIPVLDLAPYLRQRGFDVDVSCFDNRPQGAYDVVGLSCISSYSGGSLNQLGVLKSTYQNSKIIVGGKWTFNLSLDEEKSIASIGVEIAHGSGELYFTQQETDYANYPTWNVSDYRNLHKRGNWYIMSSRGCPFKCHFCNNTESRISYFSPDRTADIVSMVLDSEGMVQFVDDIFALNVKHMESILEACHRKNITIEGRNSFFIHVNAINDPIIEMIKRYRPYKVFVGIESGDDRMLKEMGKGTTVEKIMKVIPAVSKFAPIEGLWLIGFPGESEESLKNTCTTFTALRPYLKTNWVSLYQPIYGTIGYDKAIKEGGIFRNSSSIAEIGYIPKGLTGDMLSSYRNKMFSI